MKPKKPSSLKAGEVKMMRGIWETIKMTKHFWIIFINMKKKE